MPNTGVTERAYRGASWLCTVVQARLPGQVTAEAEKSQLSHRVKNKKKQKMGRKKKGKKEKSQPYIISSKPGKLGSVRDSRQTAIIYRNSASGLVQWRKESQLRLP